MKYYEAFLKLGCFTFSEAVNVVGLEATTKSILKYYIAKGYIAKVRRGLYVAISLLDHESAASKYEVASKLSDTAVISYHSAFEYYGCANQVSYHVTVADESRWKDFDFGGFSYLRIVPTIHSGIVANNRVRVSDIERTVIDSIDRFERTMGFEELIQCISLVPSLNEERMLQYLDEYGKNFLYQKTGYIFEHFKDEFDISQDFLDECKKKSGNSSRYLLKETPRSGVDFSSRWHLSLPPNLWRNVESVGDIDANV